ncbi:hypothetical protein ACOL3G_01705 [Aliarcobacter butzleri]
MSCDKEKSCFYLELGKGIKIVLIISLIVSLMPSFLENIQNFVNGLNIGSIKTKDIEIQFYQKNLNNIVEAASNEDVSKEEILKLVSKVKESGKIISEINKEILSEKLDNFQETVAELSKLNGYEKCANLDLTKKEIKDYLGFEINDSNLTSYINKEFVLLKSIDTSNGCNMSYYSPITIKIGTSVIIKNIYKKELLYSIEVNYQR